MERRGVGCTSSVMKGVSSCSEGRIRDMEQLWDRTAVEVLDGRKSVLGEGARNVANERLLELREMLLQGLRTKDKEEEELDRLLASSRSKVKSLENQIRIARQTIPSEVEQSIARALQTAVEEVSSPLSIDTATGDDEKHQDLETMTLPTEKLQQLESNFKLSELSVNALTKNIPQLLDAMDKATMVLREQTRKPSINTETPQNQESSS